MNGWINGTVIHGLHNGELFGFPTANLQTADDNLEKGVFAVKVRFEDTLYYGMLYVGSRPTLHLTSLTVEVNIFNFKQDIYGKNVSIFIVRKIRDEKKFSSTDELIRQMEQDRETVKKLFAKRRDSRICQNLISPQVKTNNPNNTQ
jgi:riboflavin kinase / FMN adenylyltransferase